MHFEIVIEDPSGKKFLDLMIPRIIGNEHSFRTHHYMGIGRIPKNLSNVQDPKHRFLLEHLPGLMNGLGKTFAAWLPHNPACLVVICDLDKKCMKDFKDELCSVLNACITKPDTLFCIAIEEMEAWFLGDIPAIKKAYPKAKDNILDNYMVDSICNTWEKLADAIYSGGSRKLSSQAWYAIGLEKSKWAENITPYIDIDQNRSPSFQYLVTKIKQKCSA